MEEEANSRNILLVDEEVFSTEGYKLLLKKDGFKVMVVNNGLSALKMLTSQDFDLVIVNLLTTDGQKVDRKSTRLNSSH